MATDTVPAVISDLEREHYEAIIELNEEFIRGNNKYLCLKEESSTAKKRVDAVAHELSMLIAHGPDNQRKLPFLQRNGYDQAEEADTLGWREQSIAGSLGLTAKILEKLEDAGVTTIGELEDLRAGAGLRSVGGIGEATADKIEAQVLEWLTENRDKFGETVEQSEDDDEDTDDDENEDSDI